MENSSSKNQHLSRETPREKGVSVPNTKKYAVKLTKGKMSEKDKEEDREIWQGCKARNRQAFNRLFKKYAKKLVLFIAVNFRLRAIQAEDIVQEMFMNVWLIMDDLPDDVKNLWSLLARRAKYIALNINRKEINRERIKEEIADRYTTIIEPDYGMLTVDLKMIARNEFEDDQESLDIINLILLEYTVKEIAQILDIPQKRLYRKKAKAIERLREAVRAYV